MVKLFVRAISDVNLDCPLAIVALFFRAPLVIVVIIGIIGTVGMLAASGRDDWRANRRCER
jgi:hypothetical protein